MEKRSCVKGLLIAFVYLILSPASYAVNPESLSEDEYVNAYFSIYDDYIAGNGNISREEIGDIVEYYLTSKDLAGNLYVTGQKSGRMIGSILADSGVVFDCGVCGSGVLNSKCCIYRAGQEPMMYECVGTEVRGVNNYTWKEIYQCTFGCCANRCCRDTNPTTTTIQPTTTTAASTTTSTTQGTTTTTGPDNCQSDTDCINKYGGCYTCPYIGADCSQGSANCKTDYNCSSYGWDWKCVSQCCIPPGATTTTGQTSTTSGSSTSTTTPSGTTTTTSSVSTTTVSTGDCVTLINNGDPNDKADIVFMGVGYDSSQMDQFVNSIEQGTDKIFSVEPFKSNKNKFNVYYTKKFLVSGFSKNDVIKLASDCPCTHRIVIDNRNPSDCCYTYFSGYLLTDKNGQGVVHEFGHLFGDLYDEWSLKTTYCDYSPAPNCDVAGCPSWAGTPGTGCYLGCGVNCDNWYRPTNTCRMQNNGPFCSVCMKQLLSVLSKYK